MIKSLIVDDEYLVRIGLRQTIPWSSLGIEVVAEAEDGQSGLELALEHRPDIIITDIKMPFMDGIEFMRRVRESGLDANFIVLSGYGDFEYAKGAIRYGAVEYLLKPVENEKIVDALQQSIQRLRRDQTVLDLGRRKLLSDLVGLLKAIRNKKTKATVRLVEEAVAFLQCHFADNLTVNDIAVHLQISPYYLMHLFKEDLHVTLIDYLTSYRIEQAKRFLNTKNYKIYEVSQLVGYTDPRYFGQLFRKHTGMTPREYIKSSIYE
jgi:two-component system, response regulator YesN